MAPDPMLLEDPMIAEPARDTVRDGTSPARDERSMFILELGVASLALLASVLLLLVR